MNLDYNGFLMVIRKESARIVNDGGDPIPDSVMNDCLDVIREWMCYQDGGKSKIMELLKPYRLSTTSERKRRAQVLRVAAIQSSRFTRLRQRRGLPFKSRRQP
jgi:hypothetical protein